MGRVGVREARGHFRGHRGRHGLSAMGIGAAFCWAMPALFLRAVLSLRPGEARCRVVWTYC